MLAEFVRVFTVATVALAATTLSAGCGIPRVNRLLADDEEVVHLCAEGELLVGAGFHDFTPSLSVVGDTLRLAGYWQRPEETQAVLHDGKLWTGDLAYCDEEGYFYIVSRKSDMIKCGSHRIAPKEIEEIILEMDAVHETAVIGAEDEILGESIMAYVVLNHECTETEKDII